MRSVGLELQYTGESILYKLEGLTGAQGDENFNAAVLGAERTVYSILDTLHRICEPSIRIVRKFIPSFGNIDISPIFVFILLEFLKRLIIEYWPI